MRRWQQVISCYLALCLPLAGTVGLSPVLHRLLEHGNQGPAHIHSGIFPNSSAGTDSLTHTHGRVAHRHQPHPPASNDHLARQRPFTHPHQFRLPTIHLVGLWHALSQFLAHPRSSPAPENSDHHHHSLPQLLAGGLIEQFLELPQHFCATDPVDFLTATGEFPSFTPDWDPQTASRAPPVTSS